MAVPTVNSLPSSTLLAVRRKRARKMVAALRALRIQYALGAGNTSIPSPSSASSASDNNNDINREWVPEEQSDNSPVWAPILKGLARPSGGLGQSSYLRGGGDSDSEPSSLEPESESGVRGSYVPPVDQVLAANGNTVTVDSYDYREDYLGFLMLDSLWRNLPELW